MASPSEPPDSSFLRRAFNIIDATACFLSKRHISCTPERIVAMARPSCPGLLASHIFEMAKIAPNVFALHTTLGEEGSGMTTHVALLPAGDTAKASAKRRLLFELACDAADEGALDGSSGQKRRRANVVSTGDSVDTAAGSAASAPDAVAGAVAEATLKSVAASIDSTTIDWAGIEAFLSSLPFHTSQMACSAVLPPRAPRHATLTRATDIPAPLWSALSSTGIGELFSHQAQAIDAGLAGNHVLISTGTSSGKSLAFYVPILAALLSDPRRVCIFVFPTKALSQDQFRSLSALVACEPALSACARPALLDGDTPYADRSAVKLDANILFTNPDTIHATLLPGHRAYARVFEGLHAVVLDESHVYRGLFGSHVAMILRRLVRIARRYGSRPQFIGATATIGNPLQHFRALAPVGSPGAAIDAAAEVPVVLIGPEDEGCAMGRQRFILWDPPLVFPAAATDASVEGGDADAKRHRRGRGRGLGRTLADTRRRSGAHLQLDKAASASAGDSGAVHASRPSSAPPASPSSSAEAPHPAGDPAIDGSCVRVRTDWRAVVAGLVGADVMRALWGEGGARAAQRVAAAAAAKGVRDSAEAEPPPAASPAPPAWLPRWIASRESTGPRRRSAFVEAGLLLAALVRAGCRTLAFARSRGGAELLLQLTHEQLSAHGDGALCAKVQSYRAGYVKEQRRRIERALFGGELLAVVATSALELGVDIGCLDVTLLLGCPATAASGAQQAGRAGRGGRDSTCIVVATDSPIDRFFVERPEALWGRAAEPALLSLINPEVLRAHALCAAAEMPLTPEDIGVFGHALGDAMLGLRAEGALIPALLPREGAAASTNVPTFIPAAWAKATAYRVGIRAMDEAVVRVINESTGEVLDEVEESRALGTIYLGAIVLIQGRTYLVRDVHVGSPKVAFAAPVKEPYFTKFRDSLSVTLQRRAETARGGWIHSGPALLTVQPLGFKKIWRKTLEVFEFCDLNLPAIETATYAMWCDVPAEVHAQLSCAGFDTLAGCHGVNHALRAVIPVVVMCDPSDIGSECMSPLAVRDSPLRSVVFDSRKGGSGITAAALRQAPAVFAAALRLVEECPTRCEDGCPLCIFCDGCRESNIVLDKHATLAILRAAVECVDGTRSPSP